MTSPELRRYDEAIGGNVYEHPDGQSYPSVTTIVGGWDKGKWLLQWKLKMHLTYAAKVADQHESFDEWLDDVLRNGQDWSAADRGTAVHEWVEDHCDQGCPLDVDLDAIEDRYVGPTGESLVKGSEMRPYVAGWLKFVAEHRPRIIATECTVFGRSFGVRYAGSYDVMLKPTIGEHAGEVWLVDVKTSKRVHGDYAAQLAAYVCADEEVVSVEPFETRPMPKVDEGVIIHLAKGNYGLYRLEDVDAALGAFLVLGQSLDWKWHEERRALKAMR